MNDEQSIIDKINKFLKNNTYEIYYLPNKDAEYATPTNIKVEITGIKDYIQQGDWKPFVTYTAYILPSNKISDGYNSMFREYFGHEVEIKTYDYGPFQDLGWVLTHKMDDLMRYFSLPPSMLTKVVNEVEVNKLNESMITESRYDSVVRSIVRDIITILKKGKDGEYGLPEDLYDDQMEYEFPQIDNPFSIFLEISSDDSVDGFDVEAEYYNDDDVIFVEIVTNPSYGQEILQELIGELNEVIRHELEHIKQHQQGYNFPKKEPKSPEKYYTQQHELEAQRAGFKRRSKGEKLDYETLVRRWFDTNQHKHRMNKDQAERVIQKILQEK
jgi:hypothetical protein